MNNLVMRLSKRNMSIRSDWSLQAASGVVLIYAVLTTVAAAPPSSSVVQDTEVLEDAVVVDREEPLKAVESLQAPVYVTIIQRHKQADIFKPTDNSKEYHHSDPYPESLTYGDLYHKKPNYYEELPVKSYNKVYSKTVHSDPYSQPQTINNDKYDTGKPHSLYHSLYHPYDSPKSTVSDAEYEHAYVKAKSHYAKDSYYKEPEYNSHVPIYSISHEPISIPVYEHAHEFVHPSYNHHDYKFKKGNYEEVSEHDSHGIQYRYAPQLDYHKHEKSDVSDTYDDRKQSYPKSFTFLKSPGYDYVSKPRQEIRSEIKYIEPTIKPLHSKTHETEHHTSDLDELIHDSIFSPFAAKDASTSAPGKRIRDASNPKTGLNDYDVQLLVDPKHGNKVYRLPQIHQDSLMTQLYGIRHPRLAQYYSPSPIHSPHTIVSSKPITQSFENTALHHIEPNFTYKASPEIHHGLVPKYENQDYTPTPRRARSHVQTPALHADDLAYKEYQDLSVARLPAYRRRRRRGDLKEST
ncbi:uncharacterized protein LOC108682870 [Hyalella azteca]|uniref:Uncharacterized protein LOC108682870 n=1 Tax=Hyalella azteca TaxID=294128 RepID=A0A8B7PNN5_HYAAZ|nr:uncharacterized protein LOC108682870 [Hyalella azteca]